MSASSFYHFFPSNRARQGSDRSARDAFARRLAGSPTFTPAQKLHAIPEAIGVIQSALEAQFGRAVGCPFGNFAAELSTTTHLRAHLATASMRHRAPAGATPVSSARHRSVPACSRISRAVSGIILLAKLNDSVVAGLSPSLHYIITSIFQTPFLS